MALSRTHTLRWLAAQLGITERQAKTARRRGRLVEDADGWVYTVHDPLGRAAMTVTIPRSSGGPPAIPCDYCTSPIPEKRINRGLKTCCRSCSLRIVDGPPKSVCNHPRCEHRLSPQQMREGSKFCAAHTPTGAPVAPEPPPPPVSPIYVEVPGGPVCELGVEPGGWRYYHLAPRPGHITYVYQQQRGGRPSVVCCLSSWSREPAYQRMQGAIERIYREPARQHAMTALHGTRI